jgi:hypothetical protein
VEIWACGWETGCDPAFGQTVEQAANGQGRGG